MKPPTCKRRRLIVRLKPGGFLRIPLSFLRHSGWQAGDVLLCEAVDGCLRLFKPPSVIARRVERLRRRIAQMITRRKNPGESVPCQPLDSTADERRLERMIDQMDKTSARAIAAVDEALASVAASDQRVASMEREAQRSQKRCIDMKPDAFRKLGTIKGRTKC